MVQMVVSRSRFLSTFQCLPGVLPFDQEVTVQQLPEGMVHTPQNAMQFSGIPFCVRLGSQSPFQWEWCT